MTANYQSSESSMQVNSYNAGSNQVTGPVSGFPSGKEATPVTIDARGIYYRELNEKIRELVCRGEKNIKVTGVRGQRYLGSGLNAPDVYLQLHGVPGEDLGFNMSGVTMEVFGHGQNAVANTMDSGKIIVHGLGGDAMAYGMRGGKLFVRDDVGYRVGIHMKEYGDRKPVVVIGGTAGDYLGEYMAGGTLILLNRNQASELVAGNSEGTLATGIHGGEIYIFGYDIPSYLIGIGAQVVEPEQDDLKNVHSLVEEFCQYYDLKAAPLLDRQLMKIVPQGSRPFAQFYYPAYPVNTGYKPELSEGISPCEGYCPAGVPTGRFLRHLRHGEVEDALSLLDEVTPFRYSCCGFICPHLCMESCTRAGVDFPVRTAELARRYKSDIKIEPKADHPEKIAVIGGGPAGLSTAYQLALQGYKVTVYDENQHPGGKMYQVISRTRLPLEDLEHDLNRIQELGVEFVLNTRVDAGLMQSILEKYDYTVVAVGAHSPMLPPIPGKEQLWAGIDFLKEYNRCIEEGGSGNIQLGEKVVVIGGGDAAVDGIEAAIELGIDPGNITVIDIKKPSATPEERRKLEKKGVVFRYPLFIKEANPEGIYVNHQEGTMEFIPADSVLVFINERPVLDFLPEEVQEECNRAGFLGNDEKSAGFRTAHPRLSVVGDVRQLGLVTHNIGQGRHCALEIDALLQGKTYTPEQKEPMGNTHLLPLKAAPVSAEDIDVEEEYDRCLHCGICVQCDSCVEACPRGALSREGTEFTVDLSLCGGCGTCAAACTGGVMKMVPR